MKAHSCTLPCFPAGLAGLAWVAPAAASREGAAIAEGFLMLFWIVAAILAAAVVLGAVIGALAARRAGRSAIGGLFRGGLMVVGALLALAFAGYLVFLAPAQIKGAIVARQQAAIERWLVPLQTLAPGSVSATLDRLVETAPGYDSAPVSFHLKLSERLLAADTEWAPEDLAELDRIAARGLPETIPGWARHMEIKRKLGGSIVWARHRLAADAAREACHGDEVCLSVYGDRLTKECWGHFEKCAGRIDPASLDRLAGGFAPDHYGWVRTGLSNTARQLALHWVATGEARRGLDYLSAPPAGGYDALFDKNLAEQLLRALAGADRPLSDDGRAAFDEYLSQVREGVRLPATADCRRSGKPCAPYCDPYGRDCIYSDPYLLLQGGIIWQHRGVNLAAAMADCRDDRVCLAGYAGQLLNGCVRRPKDCQAGFDPATLRNMAERLRGSDGDSRNPMANFANQLDLLAQPAGTPTTSKHP